MNDDLAALLAMDETAPDRFAALPPGKGHLFGGHMLALFLSLALMWALGSAMPLGWAALIVAVVWGIIAAILFVTGRKQLKTIDLSGLKNINPKPEQTVETLQQVPGALKPH